MSGFSINRLLQIVGVSLALLCTGANFAQAQLDMPPGYWEKVRADKRAWIAQNMELEPEEAKSFWPLYDEYQKDLGPLNQRLLDALVTYAKHYREQSLTDATAERLLMERVSIDAGQARLQRAYAKRLLKVLPGRKVARYLQLESRLQTVIRFELAQHVPLVGDVPPTGATPPAK